MELFHGSNRRFRQFRIDKKLSTTDTLMEGLGVYMTDEKNVSVASGYGQYLYRIEVDRKHVLNMADARVVRRVVRDSMIPARLNFNLVNKVTSRVTETILCGDSSVVDGYKDITDWLDSLEVFYDTYGDRAESIFNIIEITYKKLIRERHVIRYNDKSLGKIYICIHHPEMLKITGVKRQI